MLECQNNGGDSSFDVLKSFGAVKQGSSFLAIK
jgi:hypothetical protein